MNVIWIVSDTLRRDHVGAYGNNAIYTPSLDAFAAKSIRLDRHYIAAFPTMPTRADHLTGRWTMSYMQWEPLCESEETIGQYLSKNGIHTAAVVDTPFYLRSGMNYDRGFQSFYEIVGQQGGPPRNPNKKLAFEVGVSHTEGADIRAAWRYESDYFAPQTFTKAMRWLQDHHEEDFFLYIDAWDPHEPWDPPKYYVDRYYPGYDGELPPPCYGYWPKTPGYTEENVKKSHAAYCGEVTMVDTWFGYLMRMVENMGLMEETAIIFTSDHGYYFGEHGGLLGKMVFATDEKTGQKLGGVWTRSPFYEEVTNIPLLIYIPDVKPGVYNGLTSAVDLMPTVMDIFGQEIPSRVEGRSLLPVLKDNTLPCREYVVSGHPFLNAGDTLLSVDGVERTTKEASAATVTTDEWTLLYDVDPGFSELYHLPSDPKQNHNIISQNPDKARELHQLLVKFMRETDLSSRLLEPRLELRV